MFELSSTVSPSTSALLSVENLSKAYGSGPPILQEVNLSFNEGEFVVLLGLSGAGKSTFLRTLNRLVEPSAGRILVPEALLRERGSGASVDVAGLSKADLCLWRRRVGMIFQQFNLVKRLSVLDNVLSGALGYLPVWPATLRFFSTQDTQRALGNLERVGLLSQAYQRADTLSGGQAQRVAIARALMQKPAVILADEPVASLDPRLSTTILDILKRIAREDRLTVLVSLHTLELAKQYADRIVGLAGGRVVFDGPPAKLNDEALDRIYRRAENTGALSI